MKKFSYLIVIVLISGLVLAGCSLLSNISQVPTTGQSGIAYLTKGPGSLVGLWHFDEGSEETTVVDSSVSGVNDGTVYGATTGVSGKFGNALSFDGVDDYVEIDDSTSLDITGDLTIEAWVKFESFPAPHSYIVGKDTAGQRSYGLFVDGGHYNKTGKVGFIVFSASSYTIHWGDTELNTGQWYHIAGTYNYATDGTSVMEVYVNGYSDSQRTTNAVGPIYSGSANLQIGARQYPPEYWRCFVDGVIDEVRIWDRALTAGEIAYNYVLGEVPIDIKPGSDPNSINLDSNGVIPVAILGSAIFNASTVDPLTVNLAGADVRLKGKSENAGSLEYVNDDEYLDLVVQVYTNQLDVSVGDDEIYEIFLTAYTYDGLAISGSDEVRIVPPK